MTQEEKARAFEKTRRMKNISNIFCDEHCHNTADAFLTTQFLYASQMFHGMREMLKTFGLWEEYKDYVCKKNTEEFGFCFAQAKDFPDWRYSLSEVIDEVERI